MTPDASKHAPAPANVRALVRATGLTQNALAARIGIDPRAIRHWLAGKYEMPYTTQYCLEALARSKVK